MAMYNLAALLEGSAARYPQRTAIVLGSDRFSYAQVNAAANQVANLLAGRGIGRGDKVALMCPNLPQFSFVYWGILKAGATVVPLNILLKAREVAYHLDDCEVRALFAFEGSPELPIGTEAHAGFQLAGAEHFTVITADPDAPSPIAGAPTLGQLLAAQSQEFATVATDEDDTAVILYTSGTTGQAKGAELRHRNMRDNVLVDAQLFETDAERPDTYLGVLPLFHSFGQTVIQNGAAAFGGTMVLLPRFDPVEALRLMLSQRVTMFAGVPTMYWAMLRADAGDIDIAAIAANLRVAMSGGSALPVEVHREFEERFGVTILEGYGLSETSPVASFSVYGSPARPGSIGVPIPGVEMKLIELGGWREVDWTPEATGEIAIRGTNVFKGYYGRPEATAEAISVDGWFRSGDVARRDEDGWYYIVDRAKDMINRGGFNVYPREIEEVLMTHPAISLAAVIGVPDARAGEEVKAFVIPREGAAVTSEELVAWSRDQMAAYKYPRSVEVVDALPMTATGKILKRQLK
ncbi:MAG: long-chain fatty acid--CoA ligase [Frankiaceae bacterium]|nr:long-chain fatty acid--CoA ligase [Frankiaceae bacterium]